MKNKLEKERTINYYSDMQSVPQIQFDDSQLYKTASGKRSFDKSTNFIVFIDPQNGFDLGLLDRLVELLESSEIEREISIVIEGSINTDLSSYSNLINLGYDIFLISALPLQFSDILICRYSSTEHLYNYFILNSYTFSALNGYISVESKI